MKNTELSMTEINDGGPAFPNPALANEAYNFSRDVTGMTLRDWFAGQAPAVPDWFMWGEIIAQKENEPWIGASNDEKNAFSAEIQELAMRRIIAWPWAYADAMIAARSAQ